jgi:hypothetical protein
MTNDTQKHHEARRLHKLGFKLCALHPMSKRPLGDDWQVNPVAAIDAAASGYGAVLALNGLCSIDPDNVGPAGAGLLRCGFDLDEIMAAGVRTTSTRPGSGGRSAFKAADGLRWITFKSKTQGTILELRAKSSNLQDTLPGTVYLDAAGNGPYRQEYATTRTLDQAAGLPPAFLAWWKRMSEDVNFLREQQELLVGPEVQLAVSCGSGKLAFNSGMRVTFNANHEVTDILERHAYTNDERDRWAPHTASGAPCVRLIKGKSDLWQSDHASDPLHGTFDAWVAYVTLDHGGDLSAAELAYDAKYHEHVGNEFDCLTPEQERETMREARREYQKQENERIGEGDRRVPRAELLTLDKALNRFVFLSDGSRVADIFNPHYDLAYQDWAATFAASKAAVKQSPKRTANGDMKPQPDKLIPVSELWKSARARQTAVCRTFKADGGLMLADPSGRLALNTWKPFDRTLKVDDLNAAGLGIFLEHIEFLFPDAKDRGRFLDWLAHIEQRPGELPSTGWLHIAREFGLGRNWLASVLARIWAGSVAANLDLVQLLKSGFSGQLSRKVLAVVDEIREGGRDTQWEHAERLKSVITEEHRLINPKYGRQSVEFNACRWLMFSNHISAIPMEAGDRRFEVVSVDAKPRSVDYYAKLYAASNDPMFIAAVAAFLARRDLRAFKPGAHAAKTEAKQAATKASQSPMATWCEMLVHHWPADVVRSSDLYKVLEGNEGFGDGSLNAAHRRTMEQFGLTPYGRLVRPVPGGAAVRVTIVRNREKWKDAGTDAIRAELFRPKNPKGLDPRAVLLTAAADFDENF